MELTSPTKKNLTTIVNTTLIMIAIGIVYAIVFGRGHPHTFLNAIAIGFIIGFGSSVVEIFWFSKFRQRFPFSVLLALRTLFYVVLISSATIYIGALHHAWMKSIPFVKTFETEEFRQFIGGEFFQILAYALAMSFAVNFVRQVNRLLGHNALLEFITGKYHQPITEERIFMFLDLKSSTAIAERLGDITYHSFLNDFFHDISPAIQESKGSIYQYVGDEVVVTWTKEKGFRDANCINCYFRIAAAIHLQSDKYENRYGIIPEFKAGYHFVPVVSGEIGDIKKEIVFHGDTVNTAARIRTECTNFKQDLLLSADLLDRLSITDYLSPKSIGKIKLRGKEEEVELFSILEAA